MSNIKHTLKNGWTIHATLRPAPTPRLANGRPGRLSGGRVLEIQVRDAEAYGVLITPDELHALLALDAVASETADAVPEAPTSENEQATV